MKLLSSVTRLAAVLLSLSAPLASAGAGTPAARPNVLFIAVDDLNVALGAYGDRLAKTPNIDRLAARGVRFDRAYCQYPLCNPSRVSFLSGRRPESTGVYVLNTPIRAAVPDGVLLPQFFRQHGYLAVGAGKIAHNVRMNDAAAWDEYEDGPGEDAGEQAAIKARYGLGDGRPAWTVLESDGSRTRDGLNARKIRDRIRREAAGQRPFFLALGLHLPHLPWTAPQRFFDLHRESDFERPPEPAMHGVPPIALQTELSGFAQPHSVPGARRAYYACVSFIDEQIGLVLEELECSGIHEKTIVVLLSDHGFHLGDHGGLWAKLSAFDEATRVPLLFAGPGVPRGAVSRAPVELIDVYPTLAELAGLPAPPKLEGRSLTAHWREGGRPDHPAYSLVYHYVPATQTDVAGRTVISSRGRYTEWDQGRAGREYYPMSPQGEYANQVDAPAFASEVAAARTRLEAVPAPKPGPANRPRALLPPKQ